MSATTKSTEEIVRPPIPTGVSKARIHTFAEHIGRQLGVQPGDVLESLVARLGGRIVYNSDLSSSGDTPPSIFVRSLRDFTIYLPSNTSQVRDRFTIAHELGHLFLHFPMVQKQTPGAHMRATRWVDPNDPTQQRAEWEANWYAAAFLMPEEAFRAAWKRYADVVQVAGACGVSEQAATYRAQALGLL